MRVLLRSVTRHWLLAMLVTSTLIAGACAKLNTSGDLVVATATTHLMVDDPDASIVDRAALLQNVSTLQKRAELYGRLMTTPPVLAAIGKRAGVPPTEISGVADVPADVPIQFVQAGSEQHAYEIEASRAPYRLEMQADSFEPILTIYAQAPSTDGAVRLADAAILGLGDYLRQMAAQEGFHQRELPVLRQLGDARGGVAHSSARIIIGGLTFVTAFVLTMVALLSLRYWHRRRTGTYVPRPTPPSRLTGRAAADWPGTTRLLPWSVAGLIAMVWLTPFDRIQLTAHGPVNITLDRIVLPCVAAIWLIAFSAGPGAAPRLRLTRVHVAAGAFLACAFLSVVLDAGYLNHTGELMLGLKKVPLLVSYLSVFVIVASSIRRTEVPAFLTYTLILAVICGVGVIFEYRFHQSLFNTLSKSVFRGPFELVAPTNGVGADSQGRRWVEGPAVYGVELVLMLSIVLPIAVLGLLKAKTRGRRLLYGLSIVVLFAAIFATNRKSAMVAPAAVFVTLAYFRRRELLSLAPLAVVIAVTVAALSPGAIHSVVSQFTRPDASRVATVEARTANYDAVRPDLWTHLLFGRGQGTYAPPTDRIVDSDILLPLVETGVLGLLTFLLIPVSVFLVARRTAAGSDPRWGPPALCGVTAAVCLIVSATLYSVMSAAHGPDVFFYVAGLVVVAVEPDPAKLAAPRVPRTRALTTRQPDARHAPRSVSEPAVPVG